jgi:hypothetical protein
MSIWIYKIPSLPYYVAKLAPFACSIPVQDFETGDTVYQLIQGVCIPLPSLWDWKHFANGVMFAGKNGATYDITDLELSNFVSPR